MYGTSRANVQNAKAKLSDSYTKLLREITSSSADASSGFSIGNYSIIRLIGTGSFGKVYLAVHKFTKTKVVLKSSSKDQPNLVREIHHHRQFKHPHIARLYEIIVTENLVWMVLEYCPGDELYTYLINNNGQLKPEEIKKVFSELCGAVAYTHSKNCAHRDLKLENTLLDKRHNVKLCDFGFTREYESNRSMLETVCGTTCYMAPEMLMRKKYSGESVDVWSLGVILYTLLYGEMPFEEENELDTKFKIINDEPSFTESKGRIVSEEGKDLAKLLLSKDPKSRPSLEEILNHQYLEDFGLLQRNILSMKEPKVFSTKSEKKVLRALKSANVDLTALIDSVLSQNCDSLAGFWALAVEKQLKIDSKKHRRSSLGIKLTRREDRNEKEEEGNSGGITTTILRSASNRLSIPNSPLSPLGKFASSIRSSSDVDRDRDTDKEKEKERDRSRDRDDYYDKGKSEGKDKDIDRQQHITIEPTPRKPSSSRSILITSISIPSLHRPTPPTPSSTPNAASSGLTLSNSTVEKEPSISSRSSIVEKSKSKDIKSSLKSTMMKLIFVGNLKRRQPTTPNSSISETLSSAKSTMSQPNLRGLGLESGNSAIASAGNLSTKQPQPPEDEDDVNTSHDANISTEFNDTMSSTFSSNSNYKPKPRPISQISAYSQLSQYSMNSQVSSAPSQLSQEKINQAFQRPNYARRSTSSSISSLISRHRKTHSKASSTSSASLNSGPNSPRRVASPIPGSHSPFPRRRGRFHDTTAFPAPLRGEHSKVKLRRKSPFAGLSYRRSSTSSNRKQPSAKVIEEGEEDLYEDIDDEIKG